MIGKGMFKKETDLSLFTGMKVWTQRGRAVQVDRLKTRLKAPGTKCLKLIHDGPLSKFAFKFNLRRYIAGRWAPSRAASGRAGNTRCISKTAWRRRRRGARRSGCFCASSGTCLTTRGTRRWRRTEIAETETTTQLRHDLREVERL